MGQGDQSRLRVLLSDLVSAGIPGFVCLLPYCILGCREQKGWMQDPGAQNCRMQTLTASHVPVVSFANQGTNRSYLTALLCVEAVGMKLTAVCSFELGSVREILSDSLADSHLPHPDSRDDSVPASRRVQLRASLCLDPSIFWGISVLPSLCACYEHVCEHRSMRTDLYMRLYVHISLCVSRFCICL